MTSHDTVRCLQYSNFHKLKEIGFDGYSTVYTAKHDYYYGIDEGMEEIVALKRFKSFDGMLELFISEVSNNDW